MNEYNKQAEQFLKDTETEFKAKFLKNGFYFDGDKETRNIYEITLKRGDREYKFKFGTSISDTEKKIKPTPYDVLSCLQKYEIGTFNDFCRDFGYNEDSIKAEKIYKAVIEEFKNVKILFSDEEIEKLQEIQ